MAERPDPAGLGEALRDVPETWPVHDRRDLWRGGAPFAVSQDTISHPDGGETFDRVVVEHPGAVVILALDDDDRVLVLRQYRHPTRMRFVELPAGLLDQPGEPPVEAAKRELLEEAAVEADEWTHLCTIHTSPGISAERIEVFRARGLREAADRGGFEPAHEEADMTLHRVPLEDLVAGSLSGALTDGPLVTAVLAHVVGEQRARG